MINRNVLLPKILPLIFGCLLTYTEFIPFNSLNSLARLLLFFISGLLLSAVLLVISKNLMNAGYMTLTATTLPTLLIILSFFIKPANTYDYSLSCLILSNWLSINLICFIFRLIGFPNKALNFKTYSKFVSILFVSSYTVLMLLMLFSNSFSNRAGSQTVNLIPFKTVSLYIAALFHSNLRIAIINILGNILLFIPLGFYVRAFIKLPKTSFLTAALIPLSIEMIQYILRAGVADIDDIILNVAGELIGFLCLFLADFLYHKLNPSSKESFLGF